MFVCQFYFSRLLCVLSFEGYRFVTEEIVNVIVDCGAVPALVSHLIAPAPGAKDGDALKPYEHEVEKGSAFTLGLLAIKVSRRVHKFFIF